MGARVVTLVEVFDGCKWDICESFIFPVPTSYKEILGEFADSPFGIQNYAVFAFIADVRNYAEVKPITKPRGLPKDHKSIEEFGFGGFSEMVSRYEYRITEGHSQTWVTVKELLDFDYEQTFENRRDCAETLEIGMGEIMSYREFLGELYFDDLNVLKDVKNPSGTRIVFSFES